MKERNVTLDNFERENKVSVMSEGRSTIVRNSPKSKMISKGVTA